MRMIKKVKLIIEVDKKYYEACKDAVEESYPSQIEEVIANGIPYEERPHGEWILTTSGGMCPFCGQVSPNGFTQCRYCGADMRKDGAENERS